MAWNNQPFIGFIPITKWFTLHKSKIQNTQNTWYRFLLYSIYTWNLCINIKLYLNLTLIKNNYL